MIPTYLDIRGSRRVMKVLVVLDGTSTSTLIAEGLRSEQQQSGVPFDLETIQVKATGAKFLSSDAAAAEIKEYVGAPEQIIPNVGDVDIIAVHVAPVTRSVIDAAPNLKLIACARGGPVNVNVEYAAERSIPVVYTPGRNADAVADLTIALMIMLARKLCTAAWDVKRDPEYAFRRDRRGEYIGTELSRKTLGLLGLGSVGRQVATRAIGFGMEVLVYDPYIPASAAGQVSARAVDADTLLRESDFVSLHMRLTPETECFIDEKALSKMKSSAYIINTARGGIVDEHALYAALSTGTIAGAALDVFREEPPDKSNPLFSLANVIMLPHIGGQTQEINSRGAGMIVEDIMAFLSQRQLSRTIK